MTQIPKKLNKCPLVDVIFEMRFNPIVPQEVVFPMIYNQISGDFGPIEALPASQIPLHVRNNDPTLEFVPLFRLRSRQNQNHIIQIGTKVVSWSSSPVYSGWEDFKKYLESGLSKVISSGAFSYITRIGFRAINFFENENIFKNLRLKILLGDEEIPYNQTMLRTEMVNNDFISTVQIMNDANVHLLASRKKGSLIDIDTSFMLNSIDLKVAEEKIGKAHSIEKEVFFSLLRPELLESLEPEQ